MAKAGGRARLWCGLLALVLCAGVLAALPMRVQAAGAPSPQTGDIGTGPYIVFAISGGLMVVWLGLQVFRKWRGKDD